MAEKITSRQEDYSKWYLDIVKVADLAENSAVRGCMVIKPYGFAIWEKMQAQLDKMFKETGHQNAYFPLFILLKVNIKCVIPLHCYYLR
jgi:prolyl-tRNA synthetase